MYYVRAYKSNYNLNTLQNLCRISCIVKLCVCVSFSILKIYYTIIFPRHDMFIFANVLEILFRSSYFNSSTTIVFHQILCIADKKLFLCFNMFTHIPLYYWPRTDAQWTLIFTRTPATNRGFVLNIELCNGYLLCSALFHY